MGGHGALTGALRNPERYGSVSAFAPIVAPSQVPWGIKALTGYLGPDKDVWRAHDTVALIEDGAKFSGFLVDYGDADQFLTDPNTDPYILTSIMKKMDVSAADTTKAAAQGDFDPTAYVGTLANGGVDIAPFHNFESKVDPALASEVKQLKQDIIDGKVKVTSYLAK
jgi:S-formylglutathione hydrolase FrmB